jgi:hypothetical protein
MPSSKPEVAGEMKKSTGIILPGDLKLIHELIEFNVIVAA